MPGGRAFLLYKRAADDGSGASDGRLKCLGMPTVSRLVSLSWGAVRNVVGIWAAHFQQRELSDQAARSIG
jgi:hypothetical protein